MTIDLTKLAEPFPATDIEWRIGQSGNGKRGIWARVLAYISARAVASRLDEVCGVGGWSVEYRPVLLPVAQGTDLGFIARIGILIDGQWVYKEDGAAASDIEPFKGGISGAFKRAASAWGIGRYLYSLEAGFAEISYEDRPGYDWAKTKDGKEFYWKPPVLPSWALPASTARTADPIHEAPHAPVHAEPERSAPSRERRAPIAPRATAQGPQPSARSTVAPRQAAMPEMLNRQQLGNEILAISEQLALTPEALSQWVSDDFGGKTLRQLTEPEMLELIKTLNFEVGRNG